VKEAVELERRCRRYNDVVVSHILLSRSQVIFKRRRRDVSDILWSHIVSDIYNDWQWLVV